MSVHNSNYKQNIVSEKFIWKGMQDDQYRHEK
jgi:hypothetical protein